MCALVIHIVDKLGEKNESERILVTSICWKRDPEIFNTYNLLNRLDNVKNDILSLRARYAIYRKTRF